MRWQARTEIAVFLLRYGALGGPRDNSKRFVPSPPTPLSLKIRSEFDPSAKRYRPNF